jgi:hypothetical protein
MSGDDLDALIAAARVKVAAMSPEEREAMLAAQRESWVRGEQGMEESAVVCQHRRQDAFDVWRRIAEGYGY